MAGAAPRNAADRPQVHPQLWEDLVAAALLGTERRALPRLDLAGPLGQALQALPEEPEPRLLRAAGILALYRGAGRKVPRDDGPAEEPAPEDPRPVAPAGTLRTLLREGPRDLLPEWLDLAARTGRRAAEELLPDLLDLVRQAPALHSRVMAAGGERAGWLARLRPEWVPADDAETLATRPAEQRAAALRRLRRRDSRAARQLLEATWGDEPSPARIALLPALAVGLSPEDEPFLWSALADRRKEVRTEAASLLLKLPGSQASRDLWERARHLLHLEGGKLQVHPPAEPPAVMGPRGRMGERAWWLRETLARVPPARWGEARALVAAAVASDWARPLLEGWAIAAASFPRRDWAEALLAQELETGLAQRVVAALPPPNREEVLEGILTPGELEAGPQRAALLAACTHQWSPGFTRRMATRLATLGQRHPPLLAALRTAVPKLHPDLLGELRAALKESQAREALHVRLRMRRELLG